MKYHGMLMNLNLILMLKLLIQKKFQVKMMMMK